MSLWQSRRSVVSALGGARAPSLAERGGGRGPRPRLQLASRRRGCPAKVNGPCARGYGGDSVALSFEPGWTVEASAGGCLRHDWDTRAYAVARVKPPSPVEGAAAPPPWLNRCR